MKTFEFVIQCIGAGETEAEAWAALNKTSASQRARNVLKIRASLITSQTSKRRA
jgi:hypothetical protein